MCKKHKIAIAGHSIKDNTVMRLSEYGYEVFLLPANEELDTPVSSHADLSLFVIAEHLVVSYSYYQKNKELIDRICDKASLSLTVSSTSSRSPYPFEVPFCALNCENRLVIANKTHLAPEISDICTSLAVPIAHTAQGYAKCTALSFGDCIVSADTSTLNAASDLGLSTLKISSGGVSLPGYDYGFIGGCCGFDEKNIYFCGSIDTHPDAKKIKDAAKERSINLISLGEHELFDVGSILFV